MTICMRSGTANDQVYYPSTLEDSKLHRKVSSVQQCHAVCSTVSPEGVPYTATAVVFNLGDSPLSGFLFELHVITLCAMHGAPLLPHHSNHRRPPVARQYLLVRCTMDGMNAPCIIHRWQILHAQAKTRLPVFHAL